MPLERMKLRDSRQRNLVLKCNNVKDETMRLAAKKKKNTKGDKRPPLVIIWARKFYRKRKQLNLEKAASAEQIVLQQTGKDDLNWGLSWDDPGGSPCGRPKQITHTNHSNRNLDPTIPGAQKMIRYNQGVPTAVYCIVATKSQVYDNRIKWITTTIKKKWTKLMVWLTMVSHALHNLTTIANFVGGKNIHSRVGVNNY